MENCVATATSSETEPLAGETEPLAGETEPLAGETTEPLAGETEPLAGETEPLAGDLFARACACANTGCEHRLRAQNYLFIDCI